MDSNKKILLEESDNWTLISCSKKSNWSHCKQKEEGGNCYVDKTTCKTKPKPTPPKPVNPKTKEDDKKNDITGCEWKPSDGMYFKCNGGCEEIESGDIFRAYVNKHFPEIAKKYGLSLKGSKVLSYCNKTMKDVWNHVYNSDDFPGLKGITIGKIYIDGMQPPNFIMDCDPWVTNNYFINDYKTDEERDQAAFEMIVSINDEFKVFLDRVYVKQCDLTIDNDLGWAEKNNKKDLHKNPVVKIVANLEPYDVKWYDYWRKSLVKKESVTTHLIERKLKIKKKLKEMKTNKTISLVGLSDEDVYQYLN